MWSCVHQSLKFGCPCLVLQIPRQVTCFSPNQASIRRKELHMMGNPINGINHRIGSWVLHEIYGLLLWISFSFFVHKVHSGPESSFDQTKGSKEGKVSPSYGEATRLHHELSTCLVGARQLPLVIGLHRIYNLRIMKILSLEVLS